MRSASPNRSERRTTASVLIVRPATEPSLRLAPGAERGAATAGPRFVDLGPASGARRARPPVDLELVLHGASCVRAVTQVRPLTLDPASKRTADAAPE